MISIQIDILGLRKKTENTLFGRTALDQEAVGSNPGTVYWMDVSNLSYYVIIHKNK
jgi:hypothetical protein